MSYDFLKVFFVAFFAATALSYPVYRSLLLTKSRQVIDPFAPETHQSKQGTPTMGGLMIFVGFLITFPLLIGILPTASAELIAYGGLFFGFAAIGFIDDFVVPRMFKGKRGLGWLPKILMQVVIAGGASWTLFNGVWLAAGLATFTILFFANAFNFVDGLDGLAGSVWLALAPGLVFLLEAMFSTQSPESLVLACITGGVVVFLFYNAPPAKVFMGDVGSLPLGAIIGLVVSRLVMQTTSISQDVRFLQEAILPVFILSLLMFAELIPVPMQVAYFKLTKGKRLFPSTPIHHGFEKIGWPESRVMWSFALFQLLCTLGACYAALAATGATVPLGGY